MKFSTVKLLLPLVAITVQVNSASTIIPPFLNDLHIPLAAIGSLISLNPILALALRPTASHSPWFTLSTDSPTERLPPYTWHSMWILSRRMRIVTMPWAITSARWHWDTRREIFLAGLWPITSATDRRFRPRHFYHWCRSLFYGVCTDQVDKTQA